MTLAEIKTLLDTTGLSVAYQAFPESNVPEMPFITYNTAFSNNFTAEGKVYQKILHLNITLWTKKKDTASEMLLENVLDGAGLCWNYNETYLDTERCFEITYETEVIA